MKRSSACSPTIKGDEKRFINRAINPTHFSRPFARGRFFRPRFYYRGRDDGFAWRAGLGLRFHRFPRMPVLRSGVRTHGLSLKPSQRATAPASKASEKQLEKTASIVLKKSTSPDRCRSSSVETPLLSFTVTQEEQLCRGKEALSSVTRAAARNRAIQKKREEIEDVYRRDCDTFGVVVKMLVAKDPSLEKPIQSSLRENLREIGLRCVEAMEKFIQDYDSKEPR
ncbi:uncharacterized protein LOC143512578 [Brachyhypopomus gauderio]|uniref:uncharacterized protein LOC143512578 n=1 Tax=Brachyhypopomus gauderio TaxID=698409 RepID=UPI0040426E29